MIDADDEYLHLGSGALHILFLLHTFLPEFVTVEAYEYNRHRDGECLVSTLPPRIVRGMRDILILDVDLDNVNTIESESWKRREEQSRA